jgi:cell wall-associated NlpC family hydrolase
VELVLKGRIEDVEACMERNGVWYGYKSETHNSATDHTVTAKAAVKWALTKLGMPYSQPKRATTTHFDCSSLVARAYLDQGVPWDLVGNEIPTSTQEVYSDFFELVWPADYSKIGKTFGGSAVINKGKHPGDLQFICTDKKTSRANKITHVTMVVDSSQIVHARGTAYGVRKDDIELYKGKICAILRYNPDAPLRKGMRGLRVEALQKALNAKGGKLMVDGVYGSNTEKAAQKYGGAR